MPDITLQEIDADIDVTIKVNPNAVAPNRTRGEQHRALEKKIVRFLLQEIAKVPGGPGGTADVKYDPAKTYTAGTWVLHNPTDTQDGYAALSIDAIGLGEDPLSASTKWLVFPLRDEILLGASDAGVIAGSILNQFVRPANIPALLAFFLSEVLGDIRDYLNRLIIPTLLDVEGDGTEENPGLDVSNAVTYPEGFEITVNELDNDFVLRRSGRTTNSITIDSTEFLNTPGLADGYWERKSGDFLPVVGYVEGPIEMFGVAEDFNLESTNHKASLSFYSNGLSGRNGLEYTTETENGSHAAFFNVQAPLVQNHDGNDTTTGSSTLFEMGIDAGAGKYTYFRIWSRDLEGDTTPSEMVFGSNGNTWKGPKLDQERLSTGDVAGATYDVFLATIGLVKNLIAAASLAGVPSNEYQEYANAGAFPATGVVDRIYVAVDTGFLYRWTGSTYSQIGGGGVGTVAWSGITGKPAPVTSLSGINTGDETDASIISKLGYTPVNPTDLAVTRLPEQTTAPTVAADQIALYSSDEEGRTIPRFKDANGFVISALPGLILIYNNTGSTLTPGQVVQVAAPSSSGRPQVSLAQKTSPVPAVGIVGESIANNTAGFIRVSGSITGLNTSAFADNDVLYKDANGGLTNVRPVAPFYAQMVAIVLRSHNTQGRIYVIPGPILNDDRSTNQNSYAIGDGQAGNKRIIANNADATKPELRYNDTANVWQLSNDGVNFFAISAPDLTQLSTSNKTGIVSAVNEVKTNISVLDNDQKTLKIYKSTNFLGF